MTSDYFDTVSSKINVLISEFVELEKRVKAAQELDQRLQAKAVELNDSVNKLNKREADVMRRESKLNIMLDESKTANQEADYKKVRLEEMKEELRKQRVELDEKIETFDTLRAKEQLLKSRSAELAAKDADLKEREFLLEKEKLIDRERKAQLDRRESNLEQEKERLQRLAER